jgi:hypothetical protein
MAILGVIFDVALQLLEVAPIRIETRSKAERGFRLLGTDGLMPQAICVGPVTLDPAVRVKPAPERIGRRCLTHLLSNEQAALTDEPEGNHQMRVAIRRLRSALLAFERCRLSTTAGPGILFTACLLRPVAYACRPVRASEVSSERRRPAALDQAKQAIVSERYTESMLRYCDGLSLAAGAINTYPSMRLFF